MWLVTVIRVLLAVLSLRGFRWAYVAFMVLGLLYFPPKVNFRFDPHPCELVFGVGLAFYSLTDFPHIILFALGFHPDRRAV
jgi:hypothetical protein